MAVATENAGIIINELLTYAIHYIHSSIIDNIKKCINQFYSEDDILEAKKVLWSISNDVLGAMQERKSTKARNASIANINDIFDALMKLDSLDKLPNAVAKNIDKVPSRQPEELNLLYVVQRVAELERAKEEHNETLTKLAIDILKLKEENATSPQLDNVARDNGATKNKSWQLSRSSPPGASADRSEAAAATAAADAVAGGENADIGGEVIFENVMKEQEKNARKKNYEQINPNKGLWEYEDQNNANYQRHIEKRHDDSSREASRERRSSFQRGHPYLMKGGSRGRGASRGFGAFRGRGASRGGGSGAASGGARPKERPAVDADGYTLVSRRRPVTGRRTSPTPGLRGAPPTHQAHRSSIIV